ncbi:TonB-dependent receptor [Sphingomonas sp.]|uniref:TonB-dependent receptor n=1 Tax=Sphingomonas sp. TaxID=28214 RepID=UPI003B3A6942
MSILSSRPRASALRIALLAGTLLSVPTAALAQAEADTTERAEAGASGGDIVVTALRRNTRIQETPLAISATSGDDLAASGTTSFADLTRNAPSLRIVDSGPGQRRVLIRGIQSSGEATVGVYYDETPVSGSVSTSSDAASSTPDFRLFDVARAEVLRGPQGTLFGSGSMGGTLRVIFEKPKADRIEAAVSGNLSTVKGGSEGWSVDGMVNLPLIEDKIALRVVGNYNRFAGYVDNIILANDPNAKNVADTTPAGDRYLRNRKNINDGYSAGGRALLRLTPTERLTVDLAAFYEKVSTESPMWRPESSAAVGRKFVSSARGRAGNYDENRIYNATVRYEFDGFNVVGVTSYFDRDRTQVSDVSDTFNGRDTAAGCRQYLLRNAGTCSDAQLGGYLTATRAIQQSSLLQPQSVKNWVNELRVSSDSDSPFQWTAGVFFEDRDTVVRSTLAIADPITGSLSDVNNPATLAYDRTISDKLKQKAAYVELSYDILQNLTFTAGTRYYDFKKTVGGRIDVGQIHYTSVVTPYTEATNKEDGFIYKFNLSWQAKPDLLFYAQAAQGFRPGGVNQVIGLPAALAGYSSDSLWNYELGAKTKVMPGVYFNVAGYRIDWDDLQVSARTSGTGSVFGLIANAGAARIWGAEAELDANITRNLSVSGNVGYTDAKLSEDQISSIVVATGRKGDRLAYIPRLTAGLAVEYNRPITDEMDGVIRFDASHVGKSYSTLAPADVYRRVIPSYQLANLRFGVQEPSLDWGVYLYINNLFDDTAINNMSASANTGGLTNAFSSPPRTFGINVTKRF